MASESDTSPTSGKDLLESTLMAIAQGTASETGDAFFRSLVKHLALTLGVRYAFVARFVANKTRLRTLALWAGDDFAENMEYAMVGTPCEVVLEGEMRLYTQGVQALFPRDLALARIGAESYLAVPLIDNAGEVLGHLAVIDTRPMRGAPAELAIFRIFAARTVAEMERLNAKRATEQANRLLEQRVQARTEALLQAHERLRRQGQLAVIGGFAAGIVHEIRSPLSTVNMALDYLKGQELAEPAARRVALASGEAARLERLLSEILLYANRPSCGAPCWMPGPCWRTPWRSCATRPRPHIAGSYWSAPGSRPCMGTATSSSRSSSTSWATPARPRPRALQ
jgi:signal transduction histidine kinase